MAFMMPVVKNDWNIYKSNRSRKISDGSSPIGSPNNTTSRSRKISECRSEGKGSISLSPKLEVPFSKHHSVPDRMSTKQFSRRRTCSDTMPNRAKVSTPPEKSSSINLKGSQSWLDKLKKFMKNKSEDERTKS